MMHFIFNTLPIPPFLLHPLPSSTFQFYSVPLYLSHPPVLLLSSALCLWIFWLSGSPSSPRSTRSPSPAVFVSPCSCSSGVFKQKMNKVLPEGTDAGLKGANSSVGGCRPCEGSRVLAGEAGVCDWRSDWGKTREKHIIGNTVGNL